MEREGRRLCWSRKAIVGGVATRRRDRVRRVAKRVLMMGLAAVVPRKVRRLLRP